MIRALLISALRTGPFAAFCLVLMLRKPNWADLILIFLLIAFIATIIAFIAGAVVFTMFQGLMDWKKLHLSPKQEYVYFLPVLSLLFLPFGIWELCMEPDDFGSALCMSAYLSALFGWTNYCVIKIKNPSNLI